MSRLLHKRASDESPAGSSETDRRAPEAGTKTVDDLLVDLHSDEFDTCYNATLALERMRDPATVAAVTVVLSEPAATQSTRRWVIEVLGSIGDAETARVLVPLLRDPQFAIRKAAAMSALRLGWEPTDALDRAVVELSVIWERRLVLDDISAARRLWGDPLPADMEAGFHERVLPLGDEAIEPLKNAIITCRDWRVAEAAMRVLVDLEGDVVLPTLLEVMDEFPKLHDHDTGDVMKTAAVGVARRTVDHDAVPAQRDRQLPPDLPPAAPLVKVETPDGLHHGDMIRVWHEILDDWATGWLEVVSVVGTYVVLTDARTGTDDVRYLSDTLPCWRWDR